MASTYDLYAEELPASVKTWFPIEVAGADVMAASSTLGSVGTLSSVASTPTASSGACISSASSWAPGRKVTTGTGTGATEQQQETY